MQLCMDLLTLPSMNVNRSKRIRVLSQRGEDCSRYTGAAAAQNRRDRNFQKMLQNLQRTTTPNYSTSTYKQGTHQYIINGKVTTCTTTGMVTNCF